MKKVSLEQEILPNYIDRQECAGFVTQERFYDIGTPERLEHFETYLMKQNSGTQNKMLNNIMHEQFLLSWKEEQGIVHAENCAKNIETSFIEKDLKCIIIIRFLKKDFYFIFLLSVFYFLAF